MKLQKEERLQLGKKMKEGKKCIAEIATSDGRNDCNDLRQHVPKIPAFY